MGEPLQNPPVERLYMRPVIGWQAPPEPAETARKGSKARSGTAPAPGGSYLVGLTTFHIRPRGRR